MALKNLHTNTTFDVSKSQWINQVEFVDTALKLVMRKLSGIDVEVKTLGNRKTDVTGRGNRVKSLIQVPKGADNSETFLNGSLVANAALDPEFKTEVDLIILTLSGQASAILGDIDFALSNALINQSPGLIVIAPTPAFEELDLVFTRDIFGVQEEYTLISKEAIPVNSVGKVNWTENALIGVFGGDEQQTTFNSIRGILGISNKLKGAWKYIVNQVVSNAVPITTNYDTIMDLDLATVEIKKDGVVQTLITSSAGTFVQTSFFRHLTSAFPAVTEFGIVTTIFDRTGSLGTGIKFFRFIDPSSDIIKIDSTTKSIEVKNDTGEIIPIGTELGKLVLFTGSFAETF